jgi:hypothetical protein
MIHGNRSPSPWLSEFLNIKIRNPRSLLPAPRSPLPARTIAILVRDSCIFGSAAHLREIRGGLESLEMPV